MGGLFKETDVFDAVPQLGASASNPSIERSCSPVPSEFIVKMCITPVLFDEKIIFELSGEKLGKLSIALLFVSFVISMPDSRNLAETISIVVTSPDVKFVNARVAVAPKSSCGC